MNNMKRVITARILDYRRAIALMIALRYRKRSLVLVMIAAQNGWSMEKGKLRTAQSTHSDFLKVSSGLLSHSLGNSVARDYWKMVD
jgi:hypothetical protein